MGCKMIDVSKIIKISASFVRPPPPNPGIIVTHWLHKKHFLGNKKNPEQSHDYKSKLVKSLKCLLLEKGFEQSGIPFTQENISCHVWFKLAKWFWRRRFLNFVNVFSPFRNYFPLDLGKEHGPTNPLNPMMLCDKFD